MIKKLYLTGREGAEVLRRSTLSTFLVMWFMNFAGNALLLFLNKHPSHPSLFPATFRFYPTFFPIHDISNPLSSIFSNLTNQRMQQFCCIQKLTDITCVHINFVLLLLLLPLLLLTILLFIIHENKKLVSWPTITSKLWNFLRKNSFSDVSLMRSSNWIL